MDDVAPLMSVKFVLSDDDCHWAVPVLPERLNTVLFDEAHTVVAPLMLPATVVGLTVTVTLELVDDEHTPLVTTAR